MKKIIFFLIMAFLCGAGMSQAPKKVGVYVTGEVNAGNKKIAGQKIVSGISANPGFSATERTVSFLSELAKDHDYKVNAPVNESRIMEIGRQLGMDYVVVAELTEAMGELVISSKMMDVQGNDQAVSAENIVKVRQASDLMRAAEDVASQLLDKLNKQKEAAIQPALQENAVVVVEPQGQQNSTETLSSEMLHQRIAIKLVDDDGLLENGVKTMLQSFIRDYVGQLQGYETFDYPATGYESDGGRVLVIAVMSMDDKILYTAELLDFATARVVGTATFIGNNEMDAYRSDVEKILNKLLVKNR